MLLVEISNVKKVGKLHVNHSQVNIAHAQSMNPLDQNDVLDHTLNFKIHCQSLKYFLFILFLARVARLNAK